MSALQREGLTAKGTEARESPALGRSLKGEKGKGPNSTRSQPQHHRTGRDKTSLVSASSAPELPNCRSEDKEKAPAAQEAPPPMKTPVSALPQRSPGYPPNWEELNSQLVQDLRAEVVLCDFKACRTLQSREADIKSKMAEETAQRPLSSQYGRSRRPLQWHLRPRTQKARVPKARSQSPGD